MPYSMTDLRGEIRDRIRDDIASGKIIDRGWLCHEILAKHPIGIMPDRDFNILCRQETVARTMRDLLREMKAELESAENVSGAGQMPLPGFTHLQRAYPIERDGNLVIVPIGQMTRAERRAKATQYRKMSVGCSEHADELERYDEDREHAA